MSLKASMSVLASMSLLLTTGCSSHQVFESIKARNQNECYTLPESQREECLDVADISYEEYNRQRKEVEKSE